MPLRTKNRSENVVNLHAVASRYIATCAPFKVENVPLSRIALHIRSRYPFALRTRSTLLSWSSNARTINIESYTSLSNEDTVDTLNISRTTCRAQSTPLYGRQNRNKEIDPIVLIRKHWIHNLCTHILGETCIDHRCEAWCVPPVRPVVQRDPI